MHGAGRLPDPGHGAGIDLPVGPGRAHPWDEQGLGAVTGERASAGSQGLGWAKSL